MIATKIIVMTKTIGVIGLGSIGMRHAKNLLAMGHTVYGQDTNKLAVAHLQELGGDHVIVDFKTKEMPRLDGIVVASPTKFHLFHWANTEGPVFIEKPIAQIEDVGVVQDELVAREGEITMVGNNLRFHACVKKAKEWLTEGLIGKPLWASFTVAQHNAKYTDPVVLNWLSHECDLALYLLGPATVTAASIRDDIADVCLLHEYNVPSTLHGDYLTRPFRRGFVIAGETGILQANLEARWATIHDHDNRLIHSTLASEAGSYDEEYREEMRHFISMIDGVPSGVAATGQDGLAALELILEVQRISK